MTAPLLTHRPDFRLYHALFCAECWALARRSERQTAGLAVAADDRTEIVVRARVVRRVNDMSSGYFG